MKAAASFLLGAMATVLVALLVLLVVVALAGCGGGGDEPGHDQPSPSVDCKTRPELCA